MYKCYLLLSVLFLINSITVVGQTVSIDADWSKKKDIQIRKFDQDNGLPINNVNWISFHSDGFLYLATFDGLIRFDGFEFLNVIETYDLDISETRFTSLVSLANNKLLLNGENGVTYILTPNEYQSKVDTLKNVGPQINDGLIEYVQDQHNIYKIDPITFEKSVFRSLNHTQLNVYYVHENGWAIYQTSDGLVLDKPDGITTIPYSDLPFDSKEPVNGARSLKINRYPDGKVSILGFSGFMFLDEMGEIEFSYSFPIKYLGTQIIKKSDGKYLITGQNLYYELDLEQKSVELLEDYIGLLAPEFFYPPIWNGKPLYISYNKIVYDGEVIYEGQNAQELWTLAVNPNDGSLWIGTHGNGLIHLYPSSFYHLNQEKGFQAKNIYGFSGNSSNDLYIASFDYGAFHIKDDISEDLYNYDFHSRSILHDPISNIVRVGSWGASWMEFDVNSKKARRLNFTPDDSIFVYSDINTLDLQFIDSNKHLWIGTRNQLLIKQNETYTRIYSSENQKIVGARTILELNPNSFLIGTENLGLFHVKDKIAYPIENKELSKSIRDIYQENNSTFWLATEGKGIQRINVDKSLQITSITTLNKKSGLDQNTFHRIIADYKNRLWITSNNGLYLFDQDILTEEISKDVNYFSYQKFDKESGLPINEFNGGVYNSGLKLKDGNIIFPSQNGIVLIKPDEPQFNRSTSTSNLYLKKVHAYGSNTNFLSNNNIQLSNTDRSFTIELGIRSHQAGPKPTILYKTSKSDWISLGDKTELFFPEVKSGSHQYAFKIAHAINPIPLLVDIEVEPFFYESRLVQGGFVLVFLTFIFLVFISQKSNAEKKEEKLNQLVETKTKDLKLEKDKTYEAYKLIEKQALDLQTTAKYKEDVFIGLTHELKTPLALITGPIQLIEQSLKQSDTSNIENQLTIVRNNAKHLTDLVLKLLDTIKINQDDQTFKQTNFNTSNLLKNVIHSSKELAQEQNIELTFIEKTPSQFITSDKVAIELIIKNLIQNAIKYSPSNSQVSIYSEVIVNEWIIKVIDQGFGIPSEDFENIFEPYSRLSNSTNEPGLGIGLAISKQIAEKMDATLILSSSKIDLGSTFEFKLPIEIKDVTSRYRSNQMSKTQSDSDENAKTKPTLLLVEDNVDFQEFIKLALQDEFDIEIARNGKIALKKLNKLTIDVIISDVMMPVMGGLELAEQVSKNTTFAEIGFIFLSAANNDSTINKGLSFGAEAYLTKPVDINLLRNHLSALLSRKKRIKTLSEQRKYDSSEFKLINKVEDLILKHITDPQLSIDHLSHLLGLSRSKLYRDWQEIHPLTINDFITYIRIRETFLLLYKNNMSIAQASLANGFKYSAYFSRVFKKKYGMSPSEFCEKYPSRIPDFPTHPNG